MFYTTNLKPLCDQVSQGVRCPTCGPRYTGPPGVQPAMQRGASSPHYVRGIRMGPMQAWGPHCTVIAITSSHITLEPAWVKTGKHAGSPTLGLQVPLRHIKQNPQGARGCSMDAIVVKTTQLTGLHLCSILETFIVHFLTNTISNRGSNYKDFYNRNCSLHL